MFISSKKEDDFYCRMSPVHGVHKGRRLSDPDHSMAWRAQLLGDQNHDDSKLPCAPKLPLYSFAHEGRPTLPASTEEQAPHRGSDVGRKDETKEHAKKETEKTTSPLVQKRSKLERTRWRLRPECRTPHGTEFNSTQSSKMRLLSPTLTKRPDPYFSNVSESSIQ